MRKAALTLITAALTMTAASDAHAEITWESNLRTAHAEAQATGKLLLLHFYTDNCTWCDRLEAGSFQDPDVGNAIHKDFVPVKVDAAKSPKLAEMFKVKKFPTDVIVTTSGKTLAHSISPQKPNLYVAMLSGALPTTGPAPQIAADRAVESPGQLATPANDGGVPNYALAAAAPTAQPSAAESPTSDEVASVANGMTMPTANGAVPGQLAGNRTDDLGMTLPAQPATNDSAAIDTTPPIPVTSERASDEPITETPELAMQGFCAVTVINEDRWAEGSPQFGVIHLGKLYLFVNDEAMQTFLADPTPYTPVLNEIDVVRFFEERKIVPGKREWGVKDPVYNRMFFFADEKARNHFEQTYERYTDAAIEVMEKAVKEANPGT